MELTFYQIADQFDREGQLMIHGRVCWGGEEVHFSTGEKVLPNQFKSECVKLAAKASAPINQMLATYAMKMTSFFYQNQNDKAAPSFTVAGVQAKLNQIRAELLGKKTRNPVPQVITPSLPTLTKFFPIYRAEKRAILLMICFVIPLPTKSRRSGRPITRFYATLASRQKRLLGAYL